MGKLGTCLPIKSPSPAGEGQLVYFSAEGFGEVYGEIGVDKHLTVCSSVDEGCYRNCKSIVGEGARYSKRVTSQQLFQVQFLSTHFPAQDGDFS